MRQRQSPSDCGFTGRSCPSVFIPVGTKSMEIVQGYYISLPSATPAEKLAQQRSWLYTTYAFRLAAELGLDQSLRQTCEIS